MCIKSDFSTVWFFWILKKTFPELNEKLKELEDTCEILVVRHDFRNNAPILDTIVSITRQIMADTTSSVKLIQIIGLASAEGSIKHNNWLAGNRALALKNYIQDVKDVDFPNENEQY